MRAAKIKRGTRVDNERCCLGPHLHSTFPRQAGVMILIAIVSILSIFAAYNTIFTPSAVSRGSFLRLMYASSGHKHRSHCSTRHPRNSFRRCRNPSARCSQYKTPTCSYPMATPCASARGCRSALDSPARRAAIATSSKAAASPGETGEVSSSTAIRSAAARQRETLAGRGTQGCEKALRNCSAIDLVLQLDALNRTLMSRPFRLFPSHS